MSSDYKLLAGYYRMRWSASLQFNPHDLWVGVFWRRRRVASWRCLDIYICPLPCLPVHIFLVLGRGTS